MTEGAGRAAWSDAALAAALLAVAPDTLGGVALRAGAGPVRDAWLALLAELVPGGRPLRRIPAQVAEGRLLGGLDLARTLDSGRPVAERGLLAEADGGIVVLAMAERLAPGAAAMIGAALDRGEVIAERDGLTQRSAARIGVVALDEGIAADERPPAGLLDRLAFHLELDTIRHADTLDPGVDADAVAEARERLAGIKVDDAIIEALCGTSLALGIDSLRAPLLARAAARAAAALAGRDAVAPEDATIAARLVLAPRATRWPEKPAEAEAEEPPPPPPPSEADSTPPDDAKAPDPSDMRPLDDLLVEAVLAALPPDLLARLRLGGGGRSASAGRAGVLGTGALRGRPAGIRRGIPRGGARLNLVETLRAAAPWQRLRGNQPGASGRVAVRADDLRVGRFKQHAETTTIFLVDASGSAALNRLAEAKGAVELLLADCYVRRDQVALIAFRGRGADLLLPPTRSLVRAKRCLAALPGGGGTPLAAGLDAVGELADAVRRRGHTPIVVVMTDGKANVARDGSGGRERAEEEAVQAAEALRATRLTALVVDMAPRPQPQAQRIAAAMAATYLPLPFADAAAVSRAAQATAEQARRA